MDSMQLSIELLTTMKYRTLGIEHWNPHWFSLFSESGSDCWTNVYECALIKTLFFISCLCIYIEHLAIKILALVAMVCRMFVCLYLWPPIRNKNHKQLILCASLVRSIVKMFANWCRRTSYILKSKCFMWAARARLMNVYSFVDFHVSFFFFVMTKHQLHSRFYNYRNLHTRIQSDVHPFGIERREWSLQWIDIKGALICSANCWISIKGKHEITL